MGAPAVGRALGGTCEPLGNGSSIERIASETPPVALVPLINLLVTFVFNAIVMLTCGIGTPAGVGTPPVQLITTSPTSSVAPASRTMGGTEELVRQTIGCAFADPRSSVKTARVASCSLRNLVMAL